ncbi:U1 snRNP complex subunit SNP1 [Kluyveromyces lactis]|uniref:KLLA0C08019p n=1 Tax=Kluyveromyces lactis (strain ATCC 8585 / CBS 2359 / DSM 70799 / NBRC 1267 / NRRL Y-1140 / WM37) TaxID=284590 RepID=Q6CU32_KLULA|nr:uncharacterized protein KLLA0_C08019g [Kluyveromyces lactis]CAH01408.1 KLLA0C08019p [Kluyveromyces lactis]|eukprot:XP_452557.1 uncharacterized protein KLLA0_C08019g [Kluyveromyces lactis]
MKPQTRKYNRHNGFHTLTKLPSSVSKLFTQGPPLPPSRVRVRRNQNKKYALTGVSAVLQHVSEYKKATHPVSENQHLKVYDEAMNESHKEQEELMKKIQEWHPESDANISSDPYRTLFVGRLHYAVDEVELQKSFVKYGDIESCRIVRDQDGKSRGYGFVQFTSYEDSKQCFRELGVRKGIEIMGRTSIVDIERGRTVKFFKPRRLGGGLGGRGYQRKDLVNKLTGASTRPMHEHARRPIRRHDTFERRGPPQGHSHSYQPTSPISSPASNFQKTASSSYRSRRDRSRNDTSNGSTDTLMY